MQRYVNVFGRFLLRHHISHQVIKNKFQPRCVHNRFFAQANHSQSRPAIYGKTYTKEFSITDLLQHINNGKLFYLKQLTNIFHTIDFSKLKSEDAILLLKCCGSFTPDSSCEHRNKVCQDLFIELQKNNELNIDVYNTYLQTCTENRVSINHKDFLLSLKCEPNKDTYKKLLENVCQLGKIDSALLILELMKNKNISVDSDVFNNLIVAHAIQGGLKLAENVLQTMRTAQISENNSTKLALILGLIRRNDFKEFKKAVEEYPMRFNESELLSVIKELGLGSNESWLSEITNFYKDIDITRDIQIEIEKICIHLIHMGQPMSAMKIYMEFVQPLPETSYGYILLKEMLHANVDISTIIGMSEDLVENGHNEFILESLTEIALKYRYVDQAWALLRSLKILRPHYFWPLLIHGAKSDGEKGVYFVLTKMKDLNVKPNAETLENYVFPYCDISNGNLEILKLQDMGFTVREILSPLITVLLKQNRTRQAVNLCNLYNVNISGDKLLEALSSSWGKTKDATSILPLLQRYCESNVGEQDLVGCFLKECCKVCRTKDDFRDFLKLIKMIDGIRLKISTCAGDVLQEISNNCSDEDLKKEIGAAVNLLLDFRLKLNEDVSLVHPRHMDLDGLECQLIQLKEKNMETRGIIRRLIQMHANQGNLQRVTELREMFLESGYEESAGMKSSIMHNYVLGGHVDEALTLYNELKSLHPDFTLDSFKYIDLARLLIQNNKFSEGYDILQNETSQSKVYNDDKPIIRNCRELLSACKTGEEIDKIFDLLVKSRLCKPTNVILGPLVRVHLKNGDVNKAVRTYTELSRKYRCTPLQLEILCAVTKMEDSDLLQKVIKATEAIHGPAPTHLGLISALAENGQEKALRKTLGITNVPIRALLQKRCARWVQEGKIEPLKCLLKACDRLSDELVNINFLYKCIFDLYDLSGDYTGATSFYENIAEESTAKIMFEDTFQRIIAKQYNVNINENVKSRNKI